MPKLIATTPLIVLLNISIVWARQSLTCGQLPQYNKPHMTNSFPSPQWPWHAAIFHRLNGPSLTYQCGGTVICQNWILTAAHCVLVTPMDIFVSLGRRNLTANESRSEQSFNVTEIIIHKNYDPIYLENDIALVRLSHAAIFNYFVRPICLPKANETDVYHVTNRYGTVVGWGKTETYKESDVLQVAHLEVVRHSLCLESNRKFFSVYLTDKNFCAGLRNGTSICHGDSGGSMTFKEGGYYHIRGIVSSSVSNLNHSTLQWDCDTMEYGIYTDVAMYLQWIRDMIGSVCQTVLRCAKGENWGPDACKVELYSRPDNQKCEIIFDDNFDLTITSLVIEGELESVPDLSDATIKFANLKDLYLSRTNLEVVEREPLAPFRKIQNLYLSYNRIAQLKVDTFDDLKELRFISLLGNMIRELQVDVFRELLNLEGIILNNNKLANLQQGIFRNNPKLHLILLSGNVLTDLHADTFKGLHDLEIIHLTDNKLEHLPQGLFRDNGNLQHIHLVNNRIKKVKSDFSHLSKLTSLQMQGNVCIDEVFYIDLLRLNEISNDIQTKCSN